MFKMILLTKGVTALQGPAQPQKTSNKKMSDWASRSSHCCEQRGATRAVLSFRLPIMYCTTVTNCPPDRPGTQNQSDQ